MRKLGLRDGRRERHRKARGCEGDVVNTRNGYSFSIQCLKERERVDGRPDDQTQRSLTHTYRNAVKYEMEPMH